MVCLQSPLAERALESLESGFLVQTVWLYSQDHLSCRLDSTSDQETNQPRISATIPTFLAPTEYLDPEEAGSHCHHPHPGDNPPAPFSQSRKIAQTVFYAPASCPSFETRTSLALEPGGPFERPGCSSRPPQGHTSSSRNPNSSFWEVPFSCFFRSSTHLQKVPAHKSESGSGLPGIRSTQTVSLLGPS